MDNYKNESVLVARLQEGKEEAYTYLVDSYSKKLFAYAMTLANDSDMVDDILQNVFLKIWKNRSKLTIKSSIQNYLFKSVYNEFIDECRKKQLLLPLEEKYYAALDKAIESIDENRWAHINVIVKEEIDKLPKKCKEVFLMSHKEGLTHFEISEYLGISTKTVEGHITKAFKILRKRLNTSVKTILLLLFDAIKDKIKLKN